MLITWTVLSQLNNLLLQIHPSNNIELNGTYKIILNKVAYKLI